jgi:hypothetical protein
MLAGCGPDPMEQLVSCRHQHIVGGEIAADYVRLTEAQSNAIVFLSFSESGHEFERCSGTLVGEGLILTAKHCAGGRVDFDSEIRFGDTATNAEFTSPGTMLGNHKSLDLMLIEFAPPTGLAEFAEPLPPFSETVIEGRLGGVVQIAGFGRTEDFEFGDRLFAAVAVDEISDDAISVNGGGFSGACLGDSGGPLLARNSQGQVNVLGILSAGSGDCRGIDEYVRIDGALDWPLLEERTGAASAPSGCGALSGQGSCFGQLAVWCEGNVLEGRPCQDELHCGWSTSSDGYRCVSTSEDPCAGVSSFGVCDGDALARCVDGILETINCGVCGATCGLHSGSGQASCLNIVATDE